VEKQEAGKSLQWATHALSSCSTTPSLDARILLMKATGWNQVQLLLNNKKELSEAAYASFMAYISERRKPTPIAYILGEKEFYGRNFTLNSSCLIPRPDTETLVECAIDFIKKNQTVHTGLDCCTGSGCVGISIEAETTIPFALSDISAEALSCAKQNKSLLLQKENDVFISNLLQNTGVYDLITSNPPYLTKEWCDDVSDDVKKEPFTALFGEGDDGLDLIRELVAEAPNHLSNGGGLFIECDYRQTEEVKNIFSLHQFQSVTIYKDLSGLERVVGGIKCTNN